MPRNSTLHEEDVRRKNTMSDKEILKRLLSYARPLLGPFIFVFILMVITSTLSVVEPYIIGLSIDTISYDFEMAELFQYLALWILIIIVMNALSYIQVLQLNKIGQTIIYDIRQEIFTHLEYHDIGYLNQRPAGALVTRVTNDTNALNEFYTSVIINVFSNSIRIIGILTMMFIINAQLTWYILIVLPFIIVLTFVFRILSRRAYRRIRSNVSSINAFLAEHLSGMKIIQIFNKEKIKYLQFEKRNNKLRHSHYRQIGVFAVFRPVMYLMHMIAVFIVFYFGAQSILAGIMTVGFLITFFRYVGDFFNPIRQLADQFNIVQGAFAASERLFGILDEKPTVIDQPDSIELEDAQGKIEFKNVWFAYNEGEWVLRDVSFVVNAKESVAFVGATGAGKTTILSLITRYWDIQKGQILIDGIDIRTIKKQSLRRFVGQMLQEVFMFSGTIRSNITLRNDDLTDVKIRQACNYVNANYFIDKLPQKYDEPVRERGNNFSSGQRQLVSFARTIIHEPRVMILDEATSNIDTETEQLIQDSLEKMMSIGTMMIVAHRLSTIQNVDTIIVLSKGKIIEQGNHQELLHNRGHYYQLYKLQYQDKEKGSVV